MPASARLCILPAAISPVPVAPEAAGIAWTLAEAVFGSLRATIAIDGTDPRSQPGEPGKTNDVPRSCQQVAATDVGLAKGQTPGVRAPIAVHDDDRCFSRVHGLALTGEAEHGRYQR